MSAILTHLMAPNPASLECDADQRHGYVATLPKQDPSKPRDQQDCKAARLGASWNVVFFDVFLGRHEIK